MSQELVPVWTLSASDAVSVPVLPDQGALTPERLDELRSALANFSTSPLVTVEAYPLEHKREASRGLQLDALSPLAKELHRLVSSSPTSTPAVARVAESSEVLYKMVVPAKVAAQVGEGMVRPMASKNVAGGVHSALVNASSKKIASNAAFVPVSSMKTGMVGGTVGTVAGTAAAGSAVAVAAPLVLMAIAVGASAHAEAKRQESIDKITTMLEELHDAQLESERSELDGCRDAIDKATALLLDRGRVGASLGLDSAVHAIGKATETAQRRVQKWEKSLEGWTKGRTDTADLEKAFPGVTSDGGRFRAQMELAGLAIALKRRVVVLQGVEAGQNDPDNQFESFLHSLSVDQQRIDELERRLRFVLISLASVEVTPPARLRDKLMTRKQVDALLDVAYRLRALGADLDLGGRAQDVVIEIEKHEDGTLLVLPPAAA